MMKHVVMFTILFMVIIQKIESKPVYQYLPHRDGYVPVYIRVGDTPLTEIHPGLAAAFHEDDNSQNAAIEELMMGDAAISEDSNSESDENQKVPTKHEKVDLDSSSGDNEKPLEDHKDFGKNPINMENKSTSSSEESNEDTSVDRK